MFQNFSIFIAKQCFILWIDHVYLPMCQLMSIWVASTVCLFWLMLWWTSMYKFVCGYFSFLSGRIAGWYRTLIFNILKNCQSVFQSSLPLFYTLISNTLWFQLFHLLANTCYCVFYFSYPNGYKEAAHCGLTCLSVMIHGNKYFFMCFLVTCTSFF